MRVPRNEGLLLSLLSNFFHSVWPRPQRSDSLTGCHQVRIDSVLLGVNLSARDHPPLDLRQFRAEPLYVLLDIVHISIDPHLLPYCITMGTSRSKR